MPHDNVPELPDFDIEFEDEFCEECLAEEFAHHGLQAIIDGPDPEPDEDEDDEWFDVRDDDHDNAFDLNDDGEYDWN